MKEFLLHFISFLLLFSSFPFHTFAQKNDSLPSKSLEQVVITANKIIQRENAIGKNISIIDSKTIEKQAFSQVSELLSQELGIFILGNKQTAGSVQSLSLRGANPNHSLILIDGVRIGDPSAPTNAFDLSELSLTNVERIEIIRGSAGTLYGSSAIGGVINIITKNKHSETIGGKLNFRAGLIGKDASEFKRNIFLRFNKNGFYTNFSSIHSEIKGFDAVIDTVLRNDYNKDRDNFDKTDFAIKTGFNKNKIDAFISYKNSQQRTDLDAGAFSNDDNTYSTQKRHLLRFQFAYQINQYWAFKVLGNNTNSIRRHQNDSSLVDIQEGTEIYDQTLARYHYLSNLNASEISIAYRRTHFSFILGVEHLNESMNSHEDLRYNAFTNSTYFHTNLNLALFYARLKKLNITSGIRQNHHKEFGSHINYEVNPSFQLNENSLIYCSYATGFNAPSLFQLYDKKYGNPELEAETSESYELGIKHSINKNSFVFNLYRTDTENLIQYANNSYFNISKESYQGVELNLINQLSPSLTLKTNLNLLEPITSQPTRKASSANLNIDYQANKRLSFDLNLAYVGKRNDFDFSTGEKIRLASFQLLDFGSKFQITKHLKSSIQITNLLDEKYQEILGYNTRGRSFFLNLQYSL